MLFKRYRPLISSIIAGCIVLVIVVYSAWDYFKPAEAITHIGPYAFDLPKGYRILEDQGIDSHVGRITNGTTTIYFDFGYYSDPLLPTPEEYVHSYKWRLNAATELAMESLKDDETDSEQTLDLTRFEVRKVYYDSSDKAWYAHCKMDTMSMHYRIVIPDLYKEYETIMADSTSADYIKIVIPFDSFKNYTGMYLRDRQTNGTALSMVAHQLSESQKAEVLKIYHSVIRKTF